MRHIVVAIIVVIIKNVSLEQKYHMLFCCAIWWISDSRISFGLSGSTRQKRIRRSIIRRRKNNVLYTHKIDNAIGFDT